MFLEQINRKQSQLKDALDRSRSQIREQLRAEDKQNLILEMRTARAAGTPSRADSGKTVGIRMPDDLRARLERIQQKRGCASYLHAIMLTLRMGLLVLESLPEDVEQPKKVRKPRTEMLPPPIPMEDFGFELPASDTEAHGEEAAQEA